MEMTYCPHKPMVLCTKTLIHIGSLRLPASGTIWLGRIILFFIMLLFSGLGIFFLLKTHPFSTSVLILVESMILIALKKTSRGKFISVGLIGACVAFSLLGWMH